MLLLLPRLLVDQQSMCTSLTCATTRCSGISSECANCLNEHCYQSLRECTGLDCKDLPECKSRDESDSGTADSEDGGGNTMMQAHTQALRGERPAVETARR